MLLRFVTILVVLAVSCAESSPPVADEPRPVKILNIGEPSDMPSREWPGRVEPAQNAELAFEVAGKLTSLEDVEGKQVKQGDILATLDPRDYQARLASARAKFKQSKRDYERSQELFAKNVVAAAERYVKERFVSVAEAEVREAQKALEETKLRAPFSGTIAKVLIDNFQTVQAKQVILVLQDTSALEIKTDVPERDLASIRPGLPVEQRQQYIEESGTKIEVGFDAIPGRRVATELKKIASVADPVTQTYTVTWALKTPEDFNILPGMTAKVIFEGIEFGSEDASTVLIPSHAVLGRDEGATPYVWRINPDSMVVSKVEVKLGELQGDSVQVIQGLTTGQKIAISGVHQLQEGMQVSDFAELYGRQKQ